MRPQAPEEMCVREDTQGYLRREDYRLFFPLAILAALLGWGLERFGQTGTDALDVWLWLGTAAWLAAMGAAFWARAIPRRWLEIILCAGVGGALLLKLIQAVYLLPAGAPFGREVAEFALWIPTYFGLAFLWFGIRGGRRIGLSFLGAVVLIVLPAEALNAASSPEGFYVLGMLLLASAAALLVLHVFGRVLTLGDEERRAIEHLTMLDHLTGIANRRGLSAKLNEELARASRYEGSFCVLLLDVDHFKQINDRHGHQVGDEVLMELARLLERESREADTVGRWGGEEFLVIVPEVEKAEAAALAARLRGAIDANDFPSSVSVTASVGVASYKEGDSLDDIVKRADDALYRAKERGRNRVETARTRIS